MVLHTQGEVVVAQGDNVGVCSAIFRAPSNDPGVHFKLRGRSKPFPGKRSVMCSRLAWTRTSEAIIP